MWFESDAKNNDFDGIWLLGVSVFRNFIPRMVALVDGTGGRYLLWIDGMDFRLSVAIWSASSCGGKCCCCVICRVYFGCIFNLGMQLHVWDYSGELGNLAGQICIKYSLVWFALSIPLVWLADRLPIDSAKKCKKSACKQRKIGI